MADAQEIKRAQDTYATLCEFLTTDQWPFQKKDDELLIETSARGNDLPMPILVKVRTDRQLVLLLSTLPFDVPADKRLEIAAAASIVNYRLVNGTGEEVEYFKNILIENEATGEDIYCQESEYPVTVNPNNHTNEESLHIPERPAPGRYKIVVGDYESYFDFGFDE